MGMFVLAHAYVFVVHVLCVCVCGGNGLVRSR